MKRLTRGTRKTIASVTAIAVLVAVPTVAAILHDGFPTTDIDLDAHNVWVTNGEELLGGRLNRQIEELDGSVSAMTSAVDVLQHGEDVLLYDPSLGQIDRIDPAFTTLVEKSEVEPGSRVAFGGTTLAVLAPKGDLWVTDIAGGLSLDIAGTKPDVSLGPGAAVAVSPDGTVFATAPNDGELVTIDGVGAEPAHTELPKLGEHQLTAVGDTAVILDTDANTLITGSGAPIELPDSGIKLQQSGADNSFALVATADALLEVPLDGGEITRHDAGIQQASSAPADVSAPVWLEGCAHGAWSAAQRYVHDCADGKGDAVDIPKATAGSVLEFRVNRSVIALNNLTNGDVWLVDSSMRLVDNWEEVTPPEQEETEEGDEKSSQQSFEDTLAERTDQNRPPLARDDEFGVRPGSTTVLPVLDNDTDPDGDVLVVTGTGAIAESWGTIDYIDGGRALQISPAATATGTVSFRYTVSDGRPAGVAEAQVSVTLRPDGENLAPVSRRSAAVSVEQGQSVSYNVLSDWNDPDGDDVYLVSAAPSSGDIVRHSPDGYITFEHRSGELGLKEVQFVVSDGTLTAAGTLTIDVRETGSLNPVGTPDFAETFVGESVLISPLVNDLSPSGAPLALLSVDQAPEEASVTPNLERGTITFSSPAAGTYYLIYSLGAGTTTSVGIIRVDVKEDPDTVLKPVAVKDIAYIRGGEPTSIQVLNNDVSPSGRVIAVQSIDASAAAGALSVEVLGNQVIRVTASSTLTEQVQFSYTISDGLGQATAGITVIPVPPLVKHQPPVAVDDSVNVRAGDIVSVDVLENDFHPDSVLMTLQPELLDTANAGGLAFVSGGEVRYQAPKEAGVYGVTYGVTDQFGETASAMVRFTVVADDAQSNRAPLPIPLTGRVFAGSTVTIQVPLDGIDPDGDSVMLLGITSAPTLGRVVETTSTTITYEAFAASAGTDTFRYRVQDTYGLTTIGTINVGVIAPPVNAAPPNAQDDAVDLKPGRTGSISVLENDSDPSGHAISVDKLLEIDDALDAEVVDNQVVVTTPEVAGTYTIRYQITNGHGGVDSAFIQVTVTEDAVVEYPIAIDHVIEPTEVVDEDTIVVDVLKGAQNPGGRVSDLVVSLEGPNASAATLLEDGTVEVTPGKWRMSIAYRLTNEVDGLSATAFIIAPPAASEEDTFPPPYLDPNLPEQIVDMNGDGTWELEDLLIVPSGQRAIITDPSTVTATNSDGRAIYVDEDTVRFAASAEYRGGASITFEVTDGESASDATGRTAWITLPLTVGDPDFEDVPPTFTTQNVTVEAGEEAVQIDLRDSSAHPNPQILGALRYENFSGATQDVKASLGGSTVTISAPRGVQPGTTTTLRFTVAHGEFSIPGTVEVTTVSSTRPVAKPANDRVVAVRGESVTVPVLENDYNPFAASGESLNVIDAWINNTSSGATVRLDEATDRITVNAVSSFIGDVSVVYVVQDATLDSARNVQGSLIVTVEDKPDKPAAPVIVSEGDGSAQISFTAPATNGNPIDGYMIRHGSTQIPVSSIGTHEITGLSNGTDYTFTVSAHNGHGWSEPSSPSAAARPYGAPAAPSSVSMSATNTGNGNVTVNWGASGGNGRAVSAYEITLSDGTRLEVGAVTSHTFTGKTLGQTYTASVRAKNARDWGPSTSSSNSAMPTQTPAAPTGLSNNDPSKTQVTFSWNAPSIGADKYRFRINAGGWQETTSSSHTHNGSASERVSIEVQAYNGTPRAWSGSVSRSATLDSPPPPPQATPKITLSRGSFEDPTNTAYHYYVTITDFAPNSTVRLFCGYNKGQFAGPYVHTVDGNGNWEGELSCYNGFGGYYVIDEVTGRKSNTVSSW
ncbi:Ig-like domain-containing protein [Diaminobutyricimonas sp. LJ205]|uniref:Ig-like domain-containing protein n=1 Tax=Diaminobutyricimonas sp. LJ205 TaxID=2683590 RepID=UPI0012F48C3E|nr:Ig-like domain-containing protein [Diaminobutyricimonas sp. LJ205]